MPALVAMLFSGALHAQIGSVKVSEYLEETGSPAETEVIHTNFEKTTMVYIKHGAYGMKKDLLLLDKNTQKELKRVPFPSYKGYDFEGVRYGSGWTEYGKGLWLNGKVVFFFSSKEDDNINISTVELDESMNVPAQPKLLFTIEKKFFNSLFRISLSPDRKIFTICMEAESKKEDFSRFSCFTFDEALKPLGSESFESTYRDQGTWQMTAWDRGFAVTKREGTKRTVKLFDLENTKTTEFQLPDDGERRLSVEKMRIISGSEKLVIAGSYFQGPANSTTKLKFGVFRVVYDMGSGSIEEEKFFEDVLRDKRDRAFYKRVERSVITEKGDCFMFIADRGEAVTGSSNYVQYYFEKYELIYLGSDGTAWNKHLPIAAYVHDQTEVMERNGNLYIVTLNYENEKTRAQIDHNNYTNGKPKPKSTSVNISASWFKSDMSLYKCEPSGKISHQNLEKVFMMDVSAQGDYFVGIGFDVKATVFTKCRLITVKLNPE